MTSVSFSPPYTHPLLPVPRTVAGSHRSDSGASFLQLMSRRISELADYVPFTIDPVSGSVPPGQTATFTVRFAPLDILEYTGTLKCR